MAREKEIEDGEPALSLQALAELSARNLRVIATATLLGVVAALVWLGGKPPVYRAQATLILDRAGQSGGVLGDLAALTQAPQAASEMELLRARTTAELTVAPPDPERFARDPAPRHLALTTLVDDPRLAPLASPLGEPAEDGARLAASLVCEGAPQVLHVEFVDGNRVRVGRPGLRTRFGLGLAQERELEFAPGVPLDLGGARLTLWPEGGVAGRTFVVRGLDRAEAVDRVLRRTRVRETERSSGVIQVSFDDSDPRRAAEVANALCRNYLDRNRSRGEKRASQTVDFIAEQLEQQMRDLNAAELQVVELQQRSPRSVDVDQTGKALIEELSQLEVRRVQGRLLQVSVRQALELLRERRTEALSRLSGELADPITTAYLDSIARLTAEYELQERSDAGVYRGLLQQKVLEQEGRLEELDLGLLALADARGAVAAGDAQAVARLGTGAPLAGDPLLSGYLADLARLQGEHDVLAREFTGAHPDRNQLEARIGALRGRILEQLDNRLAGLREQRGEQARLLASYAERSAAHPAGERARIDAALASLLERTRAHLESRLVGLETDERSVAEEIARIEESLGALPEEQRRLADPLRRLAAHGEIVKFLLSRQQEAQITRASAVASAEFIDPAMPPRRRHGPSVAVHVLLGLLGGLASGLGLAFLREAWHRGVLSEAELELASGLPVLGSVPDFRRGRYRVRGAGEHFVPLRDDPEGPVAEAYRSLRANLRFALTGERQVRTLAVTSCTQGEGKSMTNIALALAFAMNERRVLLIDADMRRPSVQRYLGLELSPGLADILQGRIQWREAVRRGVHGLDVIPAGRKPANPGDLLDGTACAALLDELRGEYDLIVVDCPPALAVADTDSLAARLDATLLLVKSDKVGAPMVGAAAARLRQSGARLIGAVLNAVSPSLANGKYGYGYGYGYGDESPAGARARKRRVAG